MIFQGRKLWQRLPQIFPIPQKTDVLIEALAVARKIKDGKLKAYILAAMAPNLANPREDRCSGERLSLAARKIKDEDSRTIALAAIAPNLPDPLKNDILIEALTVAREIEDEFSRAYSLAAIAPNLPDPLKNDILREALAFAKEINEDLRTNALIAIASISSRSSEE